MWTASQTGRSPASRLHGSLSVPLRLEASVLTSACIQDTLPPESPPLKQKRHAIQRRCDLCCARARALSNSILFRASALRNGVPTPVSSSPCQAPQAPPRQPVGAGWRRHGSLSFAHRITGTWTQGASRRWLHCTGCFLKHHGSPPLVGGETRPASGVLQMTGQSSWAPSPLAATNPPRPSFGDTKTTGLRCTVFFVAAMVACLVAWLLGCLHCCNTGPATLGTFLWSNAAVPRGDCACIQCQCIIRAVSLVRMLIRPIVPGKQSPGLVSTAGMGKLIFRLMLIAASNPERQVRHCVMGNPATRGLQIDPGPSSQEQSGQWGGALGGGGSSLIRLSAEEKPLLNLFHLVVVVPASLPRSQICVTRPPPSRRIIRSLGGNPIDRSRRLL